jgi:hypothetical protein
MTGHKSTSAAARQARIGVFRWQNPAFLIRRPVPKPIAVSPFVLAIFDERATGYAQGNTVPSWPGSWNSHWLTWLGEFESSGCLVIVPLFWVKPLCARIFAEQS